MLLIREGRGHMLLLGRTCKCSGQAVGEQCSRSCDASHVAVYFMNVDKVFTVQSWQSLEEIHDECARNGLGK